MNENDPHKATIQAKASVKVETKDYLAAPPEDKELLNDAEFELISGYIDGELTQQEAQKVSLMIETNSEYKKLHDELMMMRHQVQSLSLQEQELEHLDKLFQEPVAKTSRIIGFVLTGLSALIIVGFTLFQILINPEIGSLEKALVCGLGGGGLLLLFSVLRQRMISLKKDKYNRVKL